MILVYFVARENANSLFCLFVKTEPKCCTGYLLKIHSCVLVKALLVPMENERWESIRPSRLCNRDNLPLSR